MTDESLLARRYIRSIGHREFVVNTFINGIIGFFLARNSQPVPFWFDGLSLSVALDTLAVGFVLPFVLCFVVHAQISSRIRTGRIPSGLPAVALSKIAPRLDVLLPEHLFTRAIAMGGYGSLLSAGMLFLLAAVGIHEMTLWVFVSFKAIFGGIVAAIAVTIVGIHIVAESRQI